MKAEGAASKGRIDLSISFDGKCFIFEFKVANTSKKEDAMWHLKEKRYHEKYKSSCDEIYLVGVEFDKKERNITYFEWEKVK